MANADWNARSGMKAPQRQTKRSLSQVATPPESSFINVKLERRLPASKTGYSPMRNILHDESERALWYSRAASGQYRYHPSAVQKFCICNGNVSDTTGLAR
ncbi:hypothetical protein CAOG_02130 [Capsaspora owczarzaki ATCC 30864]|uniref:Uncharacterized protein n=1 Tax=Capsaspora owczarzaki (strain ATCC 30864) TaxID=595528 RepID=A0A0D2VLA9_CAPO3|nr:hypothetical protein CAOG_02130 [Capsaspora owczarzaki ATCC 30864]KJE90897.1 hypothetical protein CAOG_002130 [Capsaspora owczarzaki ATCC 30864]|eukprot:XP_004348880.1 hypothetical protein CAOG_02130 [Capsaspora owczarzaki ATCC 30864]